MSAILNAYEIGTDVTARKLEAEDLDAAPGANTWRWIDLLRTADDAGETLTRVGLDAQTIDALLTEDTRPRTRAVPPHTLIVLRGINLNEDNDEPLIAIRMAVSDRMVVTCRKFQVRSVGEIVNDIEANRPPDDVGGFVLALIDRLSSRFNDRIQDLSNQLESLENAASDDTRLPQSALADLRREMLPLLRHMTPQREALTTLSTLRPDWLDAEQLTRLDDAENEFRRQIEVLKEVENRAALLKEEWLGLTAGRQATNSYVLTIVAALFVPISFITGLLGMNVAGIPGAETPYAFLIVVAGLAAMFIGGIGVLKWLKWF